MFNPTKRSLSLLESYKPPLNGRRSFDGVCLDFNERTKELSSKVARALQQLDAKDAIMYPEYDGMLEEKIASYLDVEQDQIVVTNGSDTAIDLIFRNFVETNDPVVLPTPSFAMFEQSAKAAGANINYAVYEQPDSTLFSRQYADQIDADTKLVVICNPNNPTGGLISVSEIESLADAYPDTAILVDEAYAEFSGVSVVSLVKTCPNIIVTRTFSKAFGLAALRVGYVVANPAVAEKIRILAGPYGVNMLAYETAQVALDDWEATKKYIGEVMKLAKPMTEQFLKQNDIKFYDSSANFVLLKPANSDKTYQKLKRAGFLVRPQSKPGIEGCIRLTIGTKQQMESFITVYRKELL